MIGEEEKKTCEDCGKVISGPYHVYEDKVACEDVYLCTACHRAERARIRALARKEV